MISIGGEFLYGVSAVHVGRKKCFAVRAFVTPVLWVEMVGGWISEKINVLKLDDIKSQDVKIKFHTTNELNDWLLSYGYNFWSVKVLWNIKIIK